MLLCYTNSSKFQEYFQNPNLLCSAIYTNENTQFVIKGGESNTQNVIFKYPFVMK